MPFDPVLAKSLSPWFENEPDAIETRMFGGFGYLINGNMCVGIHKESLILRVGVETATPCLEDPNVQPMNITGRVMKAWIMIHKDNLKTDQDFDRYCDLAKTFVRALPPK